MKIKIEATQEELDEKRPILLKAIAGKKFSIKDKSESTPGESKLPFYVAQREMMEYWESRYDETIKNILKEVLEVI